MARIEYTMSNWGSAAFPIYVVNRDVIDEEGYLLEHLCEVVSRSPDFQVAAELCAKLNGEIIAEQVK